MSEPINHHYVPVFYLSRWLGDDGQLCRYSRPYGEEIKAKRLVPEGTAFEPRLYEIKGGSTDESQAMEKDFLSKLDGQAAEALKAIEEVGGSVKLSGRTKRNWSRFIMAQMLRAPEDIKVLKEITQEAWSTKIPALQCKYENIKAEGNPDDIGDFIQQNDLHNSDEFAFQIAQKLMQHDWICQLLDQMYWIVIDDKEGEVPLMTSDRPIWMTATLTEPDAFLSIPIGPQKLFISAPNASTIDRLLARSRRQLFKARNKLAVQHAVKFVYGIDDRMLSFVQKHMSTRRHSSLLERMANF